LFNPERVESVHNLQGLDYTHANFIFAADRIMPNKVGLALSEARSQLVKQ
jgi:hypothetical protein